MPNIEMMPQICMARIPENCYMKTSIDSCNLDKSCKWESNDNLIDYELNESLSIKNITSLFQILNLTSIEEDYDDQLNYLNDDEQFNCDEICEDWHMDYCGKFIEAYGTFKENIFSKYLNIVEEVEVMSSSLAPAPSPLDSFSQYMQKITKYNEYLEFDLDELEYDYYDEDGNDDISLDMDDNELINDLKDELKNLKNLIKQKTINLNIIASSISKEIKDDEYDIDEVFELEYDLTEDEIDNSYTKSNENENGNKEDNIDEDIKIAIEKIKNEINSNYYKEAESPNTNEILNDVIQDEEDIYDDLDTYDNLYYDYNDEDNIIHNITIKETSSTNDITAPSSEPLIEEEEEDIYDYLSDLELYFDEETFEKLESIVKNEIKQKTSNSLSSSIAPESSIEIIKTSLTWSEKQFKKEVKEYLSNEIMKIISESDIEDTMDFDESLLYEFDLDTFYNDIKNEEMNLDDELTFLNENLSLSLDRDIDLKDILTALYNNELDSIYWLSDYMSDNNIIVPSESEDIVPNMSISNKKRKLLSYDINWDIINNGDLDAWNVMLNEMTVAELYEFSASDTYDKLYLCENYCKPCIKKKIAINLIKNKILAFQNEHKDNNFITMLSTMKMNYNMSYNMNYNMSYDELIKIVTYDDTNEEIAQQDNQNGQCKSKCEDYRFDYDQCSQNDDYCQIIQLPNPLLYINDTKYVKFQKEVIQLKDNINCIKNSFDHNQCDYNEHCSWKMDYQYNLKNMIRTQTMSSVNQICSEIVNFIQNPMMFNYIQDIGFQCLFEPLCDIGSCQTFIDESMYDLQALILKLPYQQLINKIQDIINYLKNGIIDDLNVDELIYNLNLILFKTIQNQNLNSVFYLDQNYDVCLNCLICRIFESFSNWDLETLPELEIIKEECFDLFLIQHDTISLVYNNLPPFLQNNNDNGYCTYKCDDINACEEYPDLCPCNNDTSSNYSITENDDLLNQNKTLLNDVLEEIIKDLNVTVDDIEEMKNETSSINFKIYFNDTEELPIEMLNDISIVNDTINIELEENEIFHLNDTDIINNYTLYIIKEEEKEDIECLSKYEEKIEYCDISSELKEQCYAKSDKNACETSQIELLNNTNISCQWNNYTNECIIAVENDQNPCLNYLDKTSCQIDYCEFKTKCITSCSECEMCTIEYNKFLNINLNNESSSIQQSLFLNYCIYYNENIALENRYLKCYDLINEIWINQTFEYLERPAAICNYFSICPEICYNNTEISTIDLCSHTGFTEVSNTDETGCLTDADCLNTETCDYSMSHQNCKCNSNTGIDSCTTMGTCLDWCMDQSFNINAFNALYNSCSNDNDCQLDQSNVNFTCNYNLPCLEMTCDNAMINVSECNGICEPEIRTIVSAQFSNTGNQINVKLNFPAKSGVIPCYEIFDEMTSLMLGDAICHIDSTELTISMYNSALITIGDTLNINDDQNALIDIYTQMPFETTKNLINITRCEMCLSPNIKISYLNKISKGCGDVNTVPDAIFDASMTYDGTGRGLNCLWNINYEKCTHNDCYVLSDILDDSTRNSRLILTLSGNEILNLSDETYYLILTCENFLFEKDVFDLSFEITSAPMPSILMPSESNFIISKDIHLTAYIDQKSVCPGVRVSYNWTSADDEHWTAIPDSGFQTKDLKIPGPIPAVSGQSYLVRMDADLINYMSNNSNYETFSSFVLLNAIGSDLEAEFNGPSGDIIITDDNLIISINCYDPDDINDQISNFTYKHECQHSLTNNTEYSSDVSQNQICENGKNITGPTVSLNKDIIQYDKWYTYTSTCIKGDRSATAIGIFRPRNALSNIPTGSLIRQCAGKCPTQHNPDLPLKLLLIPNNNDISISWNCPMIMNQNDMIIENNNLRLKIKNEAFNGGELIDCTAIMTQVSSNDDIQGEARISIQINSKPYCKNTKCTVIEIKSDSIEFGNAQFKATALDITDDDMSSLNYQFGCISQNDIKRIYQKSTQTFFTFSGLNVGNNTCYVCAIDSFNSEYCEYFTLEVTEPGSEALTDAKKAESMAQIENSVASGDPVAVTSSSRQFSYLLRYSQNYNNAQNNSSSSNVVVGRRLSDVVATSDVEFAYQTILYQSSLIINNDIFEKSLFLSTIEVFDLILDFVNEEGLDLILDTILTGLELYESSQVSFTSNEANTLATDLTKIASNYLALETVQNSLINNNTTEVYWHSLKNDILALLCENLVSLDPMNSAIYSDIALGCQKQLLNSLSGAIITLDTISIIMPQNYSILCGHDCQNEQEWHLWYLGDLTLTTDDYNYTDFRIISGIFGFNAYSNNNNYSNNTICENGQCSIFIEIPVIDYNSERTTACFNLVDGNLVSFIENYDSVKNSIICEIWKFGDFYVADYESIPILTISSLNDVLIVNNTSKQIDSNEVVHDTQFDISSMTEVTFKFRFTEMNYTELISNEEMNAEFQTRLEEEFAYSLNLDPALVDIGDISEGSVIALVFAYFDELSDAEIADLKILVVSNPENFFTNEFLNTYGDLIISIVESIGNEIHAIVDTVENERLSGGALAAIIVFSAVVLLGLILITVIKFRLGRRNWINLS